jgi:tetratricopeptide (TPR) repeat protein
MNINRISHIFLFLLLVLSVLAGAGYAQTGVIAVECVDSAGQPLKDVRVMILSLNGEKPKDGKSDRSGTALFEKVPDGVYRVVGRKKDYAPALYEYASVRSSRESATLTLKPGLDAKLYFEDPERIRKSFELTEQGIAASKAGRYADAEKALLEANELEPSSAQALYYLGLYYLQVKDFDKGEELLRKASKLAEMFASLPSVEGKLDPETHKTIYNDAQRLLQNIEPLKGQMALQDKQYDKAVAIFGDAVKKDPNSAEMHFQLALALTYVEKYTEAVSSIDEALRLKPGEKQYADLKTQIEIRQQNAAIKRAQGLLDEGIKLLENGTPSEAIVKFQGALEHVSEDMQAPIWRQIGKAQVELKQTDAAAESMTKAAELASEKDAPVYWEELARFYLGSKNYEAALDALTRPGARKGESPENVLMDLFAKSRDKDAKLAEAALERVIHLDSKNAEAHFLLGQMYYADGQEMDARSKELLTKYIETGKDPEKLGLAKDMLVIIGRRSK